MGGTDTAAFAHPELRALLLPAIRADYVLVEGHDAAPAPESILDIPVFAY
ncbi:MULTISPECIES: hypothetical protein [unclassified Streptomyces]|nr:MULTISPECIES: hypothetical protein [unclassified Streptomyces]